MGPRTFILIVFSGLLILFFSYTGLFYYQLAAPVKAEWWVPNVIAYKEHLARNLQGNRIILIGGSNVLFGINGQILEKKTNRKVVNLGTHASLDLDYFYYQIKEHVREGDLVVMPLEFPYYNRNNYSDWFLNNMMAWGKHDYLDQLPVYDLAKFLITVPPKRIMEGFILKFKTGKTNQKNENQIISLDYIKKELHQIWQNNETGWHGYSHRSLNQFAEFSVAEPFDKTLMKKNLEYLGKDVEVNENFIRVFKKINNLILEKKGKLILTWPVTIRNKSFDLSKMDSKLKVKRLIRKLEENNIKIECNPADFNISSQYFFNTRSHLNIYGAMIRTINLGDCLIDIENQSENEINWDKKLILKTTTLESQYQPLVRTLKAAKKKILIDDSNGLGKEDNKLN